MVFNPQYSTSVSDGLNTKPIIPSASPLAHSSVGTLSGNPILSSKRIRYLRQTTIAHDAKNKADCSATCVFAWCAYDDKSLQMRLKKAFGKIFRRQIHIARSSSRRLGPRSRLLRGKVHQQLQCTVDLRQGLFNVK